MNEWLCRAILAEFPVAVSYQSLPACLPAKRSLSLFWYAIERTTCSAPDEEEEEEWDEKEANGRSNESQQSITQLGHCVKGASFLLARHYSIYPTPYCCRHRSYRYASIAEIPPSCLLGHTRRGGIWVSLFATILTWKKTRHQDLP
jgi:hypothetical protein